MGRRERQAAMKKRMKKAGRNEHEGARHGYLTACFGTRNTWFLNVQCVHIILRLIPFALGNLPHICV
jgi:hypothetical protein